MKNLFEKEVYNEVMKRLNNLTPQTQRKWGKMEVAQMLAHNKEAFKVPLSEHQIPRMLMGRIIGWAFKKMLYNDTPWKKNLATAPNFIIKDQRNFDTEKAELSKLILQFHQAGPNGISKFPHPFFGHFTTEQWGQSMYKHLDHHFTQFGV